MEGKEMSLQEAIEILKIEKGVAELAISNGVGNRHDEEFIKAVDVIFNFIYDVLQIGKKYENCFLPIIPPTETHQEHQVSCKSGKPVFYEPAELKAARAKLTAHLSKHIPVQKYTGPVRLITKWCFPITGKHQDGEYKTTKPDTDNLQKLLKDVMTDLKFWTDDSLVASEIIEKFYSKIPGIYICIEEL